MTTPTYTRSDFGPRISWAEYGIIVDRLAKKVALYLKQHRINIDAVVPIGRAGYIPGTIIAYKLTTLRIVPVQYKYLDGPGGIKLRKLFWPSPGKFSKKPRPIFLVVENNHCFGTTSRAVIAELKKRNPHCRIIYVAVLADYSYQRMEQADAVLYGELTNETKTLLPKQAKKLRIRTLLSLYPWENITEEMAAVQGKKYTYSAPV